MYFLFQQCSPTHSVASTSFDDQPSITITSTTTTTSILTAIPITTTTTTPSADLLSRTSSPLPNEHLDLNNCIEQQISVSVPVPAATAVNITSPVSPASNTSSVAVSPTSPNQCEPPPLALQLNSSQSSDVGQSTEPQQNNLSSSRPSTPSSVQSLSLPTSPQSINQTSSTTVSTAVLIETKEKLKQEKKERHATKKLMKELASCKTMLEEMEVNI